jgi:hypothetical protein
MEDRITGEPGVMMQKKESNSLRTFLIENNFTRSPESLNEGGFTRDGFHFWQYGGKYYKQKPGGHSRTEIGEKQYLAAKDGDEDAGRKKDADNARAKMKNVKPGSHQHNHPNHQTGFKHNGTYYMNNDDGTMMASSGGVKRQVSPKEQEKVTREGHPQIFGRK